MTIDLMPCRETESHVRADATKFFPTTIPVRHHQLRHLISSPESNRIYFVNGHDVYCVDSDKGTRTRIARLPFEPKCIATGSGWFCAGGCNNGRLAAFPLPTRSTSARTTVSQIHVEKVGREIINSISIHPLARDGEPDEIVALLTNNDCSVKIYSISRHMELKVEDFPFPMNHASISPDGKMMMIVGDQEFVYFYECMYDLGSLTKREPAKSRRTRAVPEWELLRVFPLHKPAREKTSGYFTTAWSPSGRLCATASEHGWIVVFDTEAVISSTSAKEATVAVIPSSRPGSTAGAVRCLRFAPEPWDLLLWTEHHGRFCVADLRDGLYSRQVVNLDPEGEHVTKVTLKDSNPMDQLIHDFQTEMDYLTSTPSNDHGIPINTTELLRDSEERLRRQSEEDEIEFGPRNRRLQGLTEEERMILDSLRSARERETALQQGTRTGPDPVDSPDPRVNRARRTYWDAQRDYIRNQPTQADPNRHARLLSLRAPGETTASNTSNTSVIVPLTLPTTTTTTPSTATTTNRATTISSSIEAWRTIESALNDAAATTSPSGRRDSPPSQDPQAAVHLITGTRNLAEAERWLRDWQQSRTNAGTRQRRDRMHQSLRDRDPALVSSPPEISAGLLRRVAVGAGSGWRMVYGGPGDNDENDPASGRGTTGIAVSEDGRSVYVGIKEGIFEFKMNFDERKTWAAFEPR